MNSRRWSSIGGLKRDGALTAPPIGTLHESARGTHFDTGPEIAQLGGFLRVTGIAHGCPGFPAEVAFGGEMPGSLRLAA